MDVPTLIKKYLQEPKVMQLATAEDGQPWACTVHFAADKDFNLYWISLPGRRHSKEIAKNKKAAATVPIKFPNHPVVGVSFEGDAQIVSLDDLETAADAYNKRFGLSDTFRKKLLEGTAEEKLYKLKPRLVVLFDQINFPDNPRQEWKPGAKNS